MRSTFLAVFLLLALMAVGCGSRGRGGSSGGDDDDDSAPNPSADDDDSTPAPPDDDDVASDDDDSVEPPDCGWNSFDNGAGGCDCDTGYNWCDPSSDDCCSTSNYFDVWVVEGHVQPWKDAVSGEPWDYNGSVPDGLAQQIADLSSSLDPLTPWDEVIGLVQALAPELMAASVPPDAFFDAAEAGVPIGYSLTIDNTLEPYWDERLSIALFGNEELLLEFWDEDAIFDDQIQPVHLDLDELRGFAGRGVVELRDLGRLWMLAVEVEPY